GDPDNGVIFAGYLGSLLMAGALLAIGSCFSAVTKNQVIAFVLTAAVCVIFTLSGSPVVLNFFSGWLPASVVGTVASFSFLTHFNAIIKGVIEARDVIFFVALAAFFLFANVLVVDINKAE
ncbi:MAG: ABC transporter permease, partial [Alphaproteobacteria bacterium]